MRIKDILASLGEDTRVGEKACLLREAERAREGPQEGLIIEGRELIREAKQGMGGDGLRGQGLEFRVCL